MTTARHLDTLGYYNLIHFLNDIKDLKTMAQNKSKNFQFGDFVRLDVAMKATD